MVKFSPQQTGLISVEYNYSYFQVSIKRKPNIKTTKNALRTQQTRKLTDDRWFLNVSLANVSSFLSASTANSLFQKNSHLWWILFGVP